jgi:hypothetical protein
MSTPVELTRKSSAALPESWWRVPKTKGGLGIIDIETNIDNLQLSALVRFILQVRKNPSVIPSWASPIIQLFNEAMQPWGHDFDILYAPVTTSPNHVIARCSERWKTIGNFWHHVLYVWNTRLRPHRTGNASAFNVLSIPL